MGLLDNGGLEKYIRKELIFPELDFSDKDTLLRGLVRNVCDYNPLLSENEILGAILNREQQSSTVIGSGLAFPHCRINTIDDIVVAFGVSKNGIIYDEKHVDPVKFIFMVIGPEKKSEEYLSLLAQIAKVMSDKNLRHRLLRCKKVDELYNILCSVVCKK